MSSSVRIGDIIDGAKISVYQVIILTLCFMIVLVDGFDTAVIGYIAPALREEWGLSPVQLAPVFGAGLFGLMIGSLFFGPIADALGRKRILLLSVFLFGMCTLISAYSPSVEILTVLRFLTGLGLGGAMPTCITLTSEYSPARRRMIMVTLSWSGFTAGLALGGLLAAQIIPVFGWRGVLILGGVVPLAMLPFLAIFLPESARFMASRPQQQNALRKVVERITGEDWRDRVILPDETSARTQTSISQLFIEGRAVKTVLLWSAFFCSLFVFYLITSWLPSLLKDAGYDIVHASRIGAMVPIGGTVGAIILALLMDRLGPYRVLATSYLGAALVIAATGYLVNDLYLLAGAVFLIGFGVAGAQNGLNLVSANIYPTTARATGVSWAMACGRLGSIAGSTMGAWIIAAAGDTSTFFWWLALPVLIGASVIFALYIISLGQRASLPGASTYLS
ncbi:aromatic acid/H+ symport family MFS transporter [Pseudomonas sp. BP8]|uniref:MFS transporter n=1 Tax=Pseudomonas sp. BP8 TaxID=2817864 RepID=UPI001AE9FC3C|nr:aromatic acid/H+ symport family MFS transporter [Pseudomonas sp. BP8]MBP2262363.1 AAHS family 4-hydroxybenzoate transporter-like MFS transporter [Pseudomonas sp. BP8]HDS1733279.1 aromatic acid/H+ symport family MFS transporter [Pseudomonas putida]